MRGISPAGHLKQPISALMICLCGILLCILCACGSSETAGENHIISHSDHLSSTSAEETSMNTELKMQINGETVSVAWEDNESVSALRELAAESPVTIQMSMYGGFEQVGFIGRGLARNDERIMTEAGDIVLYSGNQIVVFYGSNTWAYTRLGHITDKTPSELTVLLGNGNVKLVLFTEESFQTSG